MAARIGVYVCHCGTNIASKVDPGAVAAHAAEQRNVVVAKDYKFMCSDPGQEMIIRDIKQLNLNRVVVASCSPRVHEKTFQKVCHRAGLNPYLFQMACIREHCSWVISDPEQATEKAKKIVSAAVSRVVFHQELYSRQESVHPDVLVVGAGIAGIQAALDISKSGHKVHLLEKAPSIGGHMAQFDKTFPTLDCAACISTPKMVAVSQDPNINLLTYSELESVTGTVGDFKVTIRQHPRYVDLNKCIGCGLCMEKCPVKVISEFDEQLGNRKAIYRYSPQSVPNIPVVDEQNCRVLQGKKCGACAKFCPTKAIDFDQAESGLCFKVGSIIVATGYDMFDPSQLKQYGYGLYEDVYTALQFERLNNATGPSGGKIVLKNGEAPQSVAILHCVGSRDVNYHDYCSRVCCMYALKYAHLLHEKVGPQTRVYNFYIDLRCFGKGYEEFFHRVQKEGTIFIRGRPAEISKAAQSEEEEGKLIVVSEDTLLGKKLRIPVDMVILCPAVEPCRDAAELSRQLGLTQGQDGFFLEEHPKLGPVTTAIDGVYLAGSCQGMKDIPDAVSHAAGAAAQSLALASRGQVDISPVTAAIDPDVCIGCRTCIDLCAYTAIEFDERRGVSVVNEALCKGCGSCAGFCPSGAAQVKHFSEKQVFAELEGLMAKDLESA
jgi:heterodisulfide reductase subunit A